MVRLGGGVGRPIRPAEPTPGGSAGRVGRPDHRNLTGRWSGRLVGRPDHRAVPTHPPPPPLTIGITSGTITRSITCSTRAIGITNSTINHCITCSTLTNGNTNGTITQSINGSTLTVGITSDANTRCLTCGTLTIGINNGHTERGAYTRRCKQKAVYSHRRSHAI